MNLRTLHMILKHSVTIGTPHCRFKKLWHVVGPLDVSRAGSILTGSV